MALLRRLAAGFRALLQKKQAEQELDEELRTYLEAAIEHKMAAGLSREQAQRAARVEMGSVPGVKDAVRDVGWESLLETLWQDIRYALRTMRKNPGFTAVAVVTLALGIGANTAIFSLIDTVMLRLLPVQKPEELVLIQRQSPRAGSTPGGSFTNPLWEQLRDHQEVFSGVFAWSSDRFDLAPGGAVRYVEGVIASGDYFNTLGVRPAAGRLFTAADDQRGCPAVAVLSYGFWQDHFGMADSAIGSTLAINKHPFQVIGVSSRGFYGVEVGSKFDVAIPVCTTTLFDGKRSRLDQRSWWWLNIMGRVKPGISADQLKARLTVLAPTVTSGAVPKDWDPKDQEQFRKVTLVSAPASTGISYLRRQFGEPLAILMGLVGLVLLIACANIASLMLARATTRSKEIAVRKALGASRRRLIRQLLTESILLASVGALCGIVFAHWGSALLVRYISTARQKVFVDLTPDARVLGFTAAIALFTGIVFGVLPALRSTRVSLTAAMKGSQGTEGEYRGRFRAGKWIVGSQVALSLVLLVAAGLLLRSFVKLVTFDIGFDRSNVLLVHADLQAGKVAPERTLGVFDDIHNRLRALPGVVSASRSIMTPLSNFEWNNFIHVDAPNAPTGEQALVFFNFISPEYFGTMRTPMLAGRNFSGADTKESLQVAIVNQTVARKFFGDANPIGKYFRVEDLPGKPVQPIQIVGVVRDAKYESVREDTFPTVFLPITQVPEAHSAETFELRTTTRPMTLASAVQQAVAGVNHEIPLEFTTMAEQVGDSLVQERLLATLSVFFGGVALLLAMVGLYGALSYVVTQRQGEFGIRMALGAQPGSILRLVMRDVTVILAGGVAVGVCISFATVTLLQKMLFGIGARDSVTIIAAVAVLSAMALLAGYLPARHATHVDPMVALRYE